MFKKTFILTLTRLKSTQIVYLSLGHVLTKDDIQPDESKVKLILDWPIPENQKELQQFMGSVQLFIKILSFSFRLACPSTATSEEGLRIHLD